MAFHQPTRRPSQQRVVRPVQEEDRDIPQLHVQDPAATDASHSWVLFEPADDTTTASSYLGEEEESLPTPGRSRLSDIGSLNTFLHSARDTESRQSGVLSSAIDEESVEDDAELDSLDSHLPEFRTVPSLYTHSVGAAGAQSVPVLPTHDGLGSFRLDNPEVQEQLYAFEKFNPRHVRRRRESLELAQLEMEVEQEQETHKMQRIEAWRLEQSRILLEEISRETRRRRQSMVSVRPTVTTEDKKAEDVASLSAIGNEDDADSMDWHYESTDTKDSERGLIDRITRRVLNDLGIDERLLSILLGEQLPSDDDLSTTPNTGADLSNTPTQQSTDSSWQLRALDRVAKELGLMVNQLSPHHHPGAFATYTRMQQMSIPYAGLPAIPESSTDTAVAPVAREASTKMPEFQPTMVQHTRPINIPASRPQLDPPVPLTRDESTTLPTTFTQEEWEQDLDVNLVFRYLRSRFSSRSTPSATFTTGTSHLATSSTPDTAAKAARVRQHHPLVSRARQVERRTFKATTPSSPAAMRHASSCASQSTRRSARRSSVSSRHYWDIGGSIGTGSVIASVGPMGSWGEV
ncbi:hypothetical protein CORC01_10695 [Colletotrichum orchidophilum]|uniref:Uncharacterized protein n=1 Tax=Colletotrichum orchidophilum TaxID=1209926 RepID=A0A1G4AY35_9PEZI|nr:uncharacterized protein CORC01_10695 [Colletotrichum orchidophilum]OHE94003.1 hypothetical protein CORC01_10695 [Colletotrichum orchidophilum]